MNFVAKVMREAGIAAKTRRKFKQATDSNHALPVAPNVLDRKFDPDEPNALRAADVTYIPTREGWVYLAVVEDLFSRKVVGWSMDATMTSRLVVDALGMAPARRSPLPGSSSSALVAHSDRGSQYASEHYRRRLSEERVACSTSRRGDCWDNAPMESFFASLKKELVHGEDYATRAEAKASIFEYIEAFCNRVRRHSSLGYVAPDEYERAHTKPTAKRCPLFAGNSRRGAVGAGDGGAVAPLFAPLQGALECLGSDPEGDVADGELGSPECVRVVLGGQEIRERPEVVKSGLLECGEDPIRLGLLLGSEGRLRCASGHRRAPAGRKFGLTLILPSPRPKGHRIL